MLRYHMAVVTKDIALKRALKRLTTAMAATADMGDGSQLDPAKKIDLAIVDARTTNVDKVLLGKIPAEAKILYIIGEGMLAEKLLFFRDERATSLFCYDERFDDEEFISSATKALRGEVFGLQKYFPWGVTTFSMRIQNHADKDRALEILMEFANLAGVRGGVRDRIQSVADELMMNALYHAPVDEAGEELYRSHPLRELAQLEKVNLVQVQYGCSGRYFGVSVRDGNGSLKRFRLLDYLLRTTGGSEIETKAGGAGLGLVSVVKSVSKLVFNIQPTQSTEVVALFDMDLIAKGQVGARSLHMFMAPPKKEEPLEEDTRVATGAAALFGGKTRTWAVAAVLLAIAASMGTALVMKSSEKTATAGVPENCPPPVTSPGPSGAELGPPAPGPAPVSQPQRAAKVGAGAAGKH